MPTQSNAFNKYLEFYNKFKSNNYSCILDSNLCIRIFSNKLLELTSKEVLDKYLGKSFLTVIPRPQHILVLKNKIIFDALRTKSNFCYITNKPDEEKCKTCILHAEAIIDSETGEFLGYELSIKLITTLLMHLKSLEKEAHLTSHEMDLIRLKLQNIPFKVMPTMLRSDGKLLSTSTIYNIFHNQIYPKLGVMNQQTFIEKLNSYPISFNYNMLNTDFIYKI